MAVGGSWFSSFVDLGCTGNNLGKRRVYLCFEGCRRYTQLPLL